MRTFLLTRRYELLAFLLIAIAVIRIVLTYSNTAQAFDEPCHVSAAIEFLDKNTYTLDAMHPPVARIAIGLPLYFGGARYPVMSNEDTDTGSHNYNVVEPRLSTPDLSRELRSRGINRFTLAVWSNADLDSLGLPSYEVPVRGERPSGWIAVSARAIRTGAVLHEALPPRRLDWLESYKPVAKVGKTIDLYYVDRKFCDGKLNRRAAS